MPPYGYRAKTYRHPNPMKANKGQTKSRLEPDGARAETVTRIAHWRYHEGLSYDTIADRLNAEPERYPPPQPPSKARARGVWGKSTIADILRNPKYTGYQVFNRRATSSKSGKVNDPRKWVWSPDPVHEPLIPKWMYDEINARRRARQGSRIGDALNSHPATRRSYILRGIVYCVCGRRMCGDRKRDNTYHLCWPPKNNRNATDISHQSAIRVREAAVIKAVCDFYADRVFGQSRQEILNADLANMDDSANRARNAQRERLQRTVADLARRQDSVIRQAQEGDPDDPFTKALRNSYNELQVQRDRALARIGELDAADQDDPAPTADDLHLLDELPFLKLNFVEAPRPLLRRLFDSTKLSVRLHEDIATVDITVSLPSDQLRDIATAAVAIAGAIPESRKPPVTETDGFVGMLYVPPMGFEPTLPA
ncbi:MAG: recombinase family protein [Haloechinothrix sp.]